MGDDAELTPAESLHAARVLRLKPGDHVELVDGRGGRSRARIVTVNRHPKSPRVIVRCYSKEAEAPPQVPVTLYLAPPRTKQMTSCVRMATELGVARIVPVICDYSVARPGTSALRHWEAEAVAAIKQSGNSVLPSIASPRLFGEALAQATTSGIFGDPDGKTDVDIDFKRVGGMAVWIGPEGGFTDEEKAQLAASGVHAVRVGHWTLRVETAVPALLGWLSAKGMMR